MVFQFTEGVVELFVEVAFAAQPFEPFGIFAQIVDCCNFVVVTVLDHQVRDGHGITSVLVFLNNITKRRRFNFEGMEQAAIGQWPCGEIFTRYIIHSRHLVASQFTLLFFD